MCDFFSATSDGLGDIKYLNWQQRQEVLRGELDYTPDSHVDINDYYGFKGRKEDCRNKYTFNPLTGKFTVDSIETIDDSTVVEEKIRALDFKTIIEPLIIKPIINPLKIDNSNLVITEEHIMLLKEWNLVWNSIWNSGGYSGGYSVCKSVINSVINLVGNSVWDSVADSVWDSVWNSVWNSVCNSGKDSVEDSVNNSIWNSVWDSIHAYTSSFFHLEKWSYIEHKRFINPFKSCTDLWEMGIIPSFDGKIWRLHCDRDARVVFQISKKDLQKKSINEQLVNKREEKFMRKMREISMQICEQEYLISFINKNGIQQWITGEMETFNSKSIILWNKKEGKLYKLPYEAATWILPLEPKPSVTNELDELLKLFEI